MKRVALLVFACAIISGGVLPGVHAQGKKGRPVQKPPSVHVNQAALFYQAAALQRQQAAFAAAMARQQAAARRSSTVVIRTTTTTAGKGSVTQPLVLSTQTTTRFQPRGATNSFTIRNTFKESLAANPQRGKSQFKETWTENFGPGFGTIRSRFNEQVSFRGGNEMIKEKWTVKASSPALASLPVQLQLSQLEGLLPWQSWYGYRPWNVYRPWYPYQPLALAAPGRKTTIQSTMNWPGGSEKISTRILNQYDKAGRFVGAQVQVKDSTKGNAAVLAPLTPQAQINLLEAAVNPGLYPYTAPLAYSWGAPYYPNWYYPNWRALDRVAALEGLAIW